jgi:hypothetical protein
MNTLSPAPGFAALGLVSIMLVLGGCSAYEATVHGRAETAHASATSLASEHPDVASWLPPDATSITVVNSTRAEDTTTISYDSDTAPDGCETVPRTSAPTMAVDADVDVYSTDSVLLCDTWAIAQDAGTWVAWTPATEAE